MVTCHGSRAKPQPPTSTPKNVEAEDKPAVKKKKGHMKPIEWNKNKGWITLAINYLNQNLNFCMKLFSNSTSEAKQEGH